MCLTRLPIGITIIPTTINIILLPLPVLLIHTELHILKLHLILHPVPTDMTHLITVLALDTTAPTGTVRTSEVRIVQIHIGAEMDMDTDMDMGMDMETMDGKHRDSRRWHD